MNEKIKEILKKKIGGPKRVARIVILLLVLYMIVSIVDYAIEQKAESPQSTTTKENVVTEENSDASADKQQYREILSEIAQRLYAANKINTADEELKVIIEEYGAPPATSFIDGDFDPAFLSYFVKNTYNFWNPVNMDKTNLSFRIFYEKNKLGEFSITAFPYAEVWILIGKADKNDFLLLAIGDDDNGPMLQFKATSESKPFYYPLGQPIAALYPLDLYDYDGDNQSEIGLRYELTGADGFWQKLIILKIAGERLEVLKEFPMGDRSAEGIARRNGNIIEVGGAFSEDSGHLGYDKYLIEKYQFKNGDFVKVGEEILPHILLSTAWKKYFLVK